MKKGLDIMKFDYVIEKPTDKQITEELIKTGELKPFAETTTAVLYEYGRQIIIMQKKQYKKDGLDK